MPNKPKRRGRPKKRLKQAANSMNRHRTTWVKSPHDWYVEEAWCSDLLIDAVPHWAGGTVLDPSCGSGLVVEAFRRRGFDAIGSDLIDRGYEHCWPGVDFSLPGAWPPGSVDYVASNFPYYSGAGTRQFTLNALAVARKGVAILAPVPFLASQERYAWFKGLPASLILIMSARPSMPPGELLQAGRVKQHGGKEDYCWIVFEHGHQGRPQFDWIMPSEEVLQARRPHRRPRPALLISTPGPTDPFSGFSPLHVLRQYVTEVFAA
jgi:hypothetical protein